MAMNMIVRAACRRAAFKGVCLTVCNLPNMGGRKPSRPAAQMRCDDVRNPPKTRVRYNKGFAVMLTVQSSETRNRNHDCKNDPTNGTEQGTAKIKCDGVT